MGGVEPHYVHVDLLSPLGDLDRVFWHEDEAVFAPNLYVHWALYGAAHEEGVRVLLDGIDGDTTVSHGLEYLADLTRKGKWKTLVTEATALSKKSNAAFPPWSIIWQYGLKPFLPKPGMHIRRLLGRRPQPMRAANTVINPVFAQRMGLAERAQAFLNNGSHPARNARSAHLQGLTSGLLPAALEMADRAAAAFGLEPRYPFFDRRLMEFCLALPPDQKLHHGWTRVIMRRAMANIVPDAVRWRIGKANLSPNFRRRLLDFDRKLLDEVIVNDPQVIAEYVNVTALRDAYRRFISRPTSDDAVLVYGAVVLARWLCMTHLPMELI